MKSVGIMFKEYLREYKLKYLKEIIEIGLQDILTKVCVNFVLRTFGKVADAISFVGMGF